METEVRVFPRPVRTAFLIDPDQIEDRVLDELIAFSTSQWGGRYNVLVPVHGEEILEDWWELLVRSNPDFVIPLLPFGDALLRRIHRAFAPACVADFGDREAEELGRRIVPNLGLAAGLDVSYLAAYLNERPEFGRRIRLPVKGAQSSTAADHFLVRSLGVVEASAIVEDLHRRSREPMGLPDRLADDANELLRFAAQSPCVWPIELCGMEAGHPPAPDFDVFAEQFQVVVGDTASNAIYAWNRAYCVSPHVRFHTLCFPTSEIETDLLPSLGEYLQAFALGHQQPPRVSIVSYDLDEERLQECVAKLREGTTNVICGTRKLDVAEFPLPGAGRYSRPVYLDTNLPDGSNTGLVSVPAPRFAERTGASGKWMVDLAIQYRPERHTDRSPTPIWRLPFRRGVANIFFPEASSCTIAQGNLPGTLVKTDLQQLRVQIPDDRYVIASLMRASALDPRVRLHNQNVGFPRLAPSDQGRYLGGLLSLVRSLVQATRFFGDRNWYALLESASGGAARDEVERQLRRWIADKDPEQLEASLSRAAEDVQRVALSKVLDQKSVTVDEIKQRIVEHRRAALEEGAPHTQARWTEVDDYDLEALVEWGLLQQGIRLRCPHCGWKAWYPVSELQPMVECRGCFSMIALEISPPWAFRVNPHVANCFHVHTAADVLRALLELDSRITDELLVYLPPHDLYDDNGNRRTDIDIAMVHGAKFKIAEVKSTGHGFSDEVLSGLEDLARDFEPDALVLVARSDPQWPDEVKGSIEATRERLADIDVQVEVIELKW